MVEYTSSLDTIFGSLADPTRRDILRRVTGCELTIKEIAAAYDMTFAAISKHLKILEEAKLIIKRKKGRERMVSLAPYAFKDANEYLQWYQKQWESRLDSLETFLKEGERHG